MKRVFGSLALVVIFSAICFIPGCTVNLNSGNLSMGYTAPTTLNLLQNCNSINQVWMKGYTNSTVLGVQEVHQTVYLTFYGWKGDQCDFHIERMYDCNYSKADLNQSGMDVLKEIAVKCGYAAESDRLCVGSGSASIGAFLDNDESCSGN